MLTREQVIKIRSHLSNAQNPLFFFDNDSDGLCSFLLLRRYCGKGNGIPVKGAPELKLSYFRRVREFNPDYIFILDNPLVSDEFFNEVEKINLPVIWIDHHFIENLKVPEFVEYYNPIKSAEAEGEATTAFCYQVSERKEDLWIAVAGCIADRYLPWFYEDFAKEYPDLVVDDFKNAFDLYYKSGIGKISRMMGDGLKDRTTNVVKMIKFLIKAKSPYDVLNDSRENYFFHKRYNEIEKKKHYLIEKAIKLMKQQGDILFFDYRGNLSISAELSNELAYLFPDKIIVVSYIKPDYVNISIRGKNVRKPFLEAIKSFEDATGGGHDNAIGARVKSQDLERFKEKLAKVFEKQKENRKTE